MTIDGDVIKMPNALKEYYDYIRTDNISLNGTPQRNQLGKKKVAELTWTDLLPSEFQDIMTWADDVLTHDYSNSQSRHGDWIFTGIVTITSEGEYEKGESYMTDVFTVLIREV